MKKQRLHFPFLLLICLIFSLTATAQVVDIPDPNLRAAVEKALGKASGAPITTADMANLTHLEARGANITDLTGLGFATNLTSLDLGYGGAGPSHAVKDLSPLAGLTQLTRLHLPGKSISDISAVAELTNLTWLNLEGNPISDIAPVAGLTKLTHLYIGGNLIADISPVANLTNLTKLYLSINQITDISSLSSLINLKTLWLNHNSISDIAPVAGLTKLTHLYIRGNLIADISQVAGLINLARLDLRYNRLSDISSLVANTGLGSGDEVVLNDNPLSYSAINTHIPVLQSRGVTIEFDNVSVKIVEPVNIPNPNLRAAIVTALDKAPGATLTTWDMAYLTRLEAGYANISDLTGLEFATNLTRLVLWGNNISDISQVAGLTNLARLDLRHNRLSDISSLVANTGLGSGDEVVLNDNPLSRSSINTHIPTLQSRGVIVEFDDTTHLNIGEPRTLRMIYFLPNDQPYRADVVQRMKDEIRKVQIFFAEQMGAHGYGNKTFRVETDSKGEPIVHRVDGQHPNRHYFHFVGGKVSKEIAQTFDLDVNLYLIVMNTDVLGRKNEPMGGTGRRYGKNGGYALVSEFKFGLVAHELGHAFGLHHDFREGSIMGGAQNQLSVCSAEYLAMHPYFNPDVPIEVGRSPVIELISPRTYLAGSKSVPIQLKISDSEGLHQAILFATTRESYATAADNEVKSCHALPGKKEAIVEFEYNGVIPSDSSTSLSNPVVHLIHVEAVDTDGNVSAMSFSLAEISPYHTAILEGHRGTVNSVSFSPDGTILASGAHDNTVRLWNVEMRTNIAVLQRAHSVSFAPDGTTLASVWGDTVRLWNVTTKQNITTLSGHTGAVSSVSFSPDGTILASGAHDNTVKLWDVATAENITTLSGHTGAVSSVSFSPDGTILASGAHDNTVKLWDVATAENITTLSGPSDGVRSVAFSSDRTTLAFAGSGGSWDNTVRLWDIATGENTAALKGHQRWISSVSFSPDGILLASAGGWDNTVKLWDVATGVNFATLGHLNGVRAVSFSPDGTTLASGTEDGMVELWDISGWMPSRLEAIEEKVDIPGSNLRIAIKTALGVSPSVPIVRGHLENLKDLTARNANITNLIGLEFATNLTNLDLGYGQGGTSHAVKDLSPLAGLTQLTWLHLPGKSISDISAVAGLINLTWLNLWGNPISDISPVAGLTNLINLYLGGNNISDISPLVANAGLGSGNTVNVQYNPLSYQSIHTHIPILQSRGVTVEFDNQAHPALLKISGDSQKGAAFAPLSHPFVVEAQDANGSPLAGISVTFAVTVGGGTLNPTITRTDTNGRAQSTLTLGPNLGTNTVQVSAAGIEVPATFHAISDTESSPITADVNSDGSVNVLDLVVIASELGNAGANLTVDVNGDGVVNILDLIMVAGMFDGAAAAPAAQPQVPETLTAVEVQGWLTDARALEVRGPIMKRGFLVLEQLLLSLTPKETELLANYPNPFNPETWIPYRLAEDAFVTLTIYDPSGRVVRTFDVGHRIAAVYESQSKAIHWDGKNDLGEQVASGVYFYTLSAGNYSATRKMMILK